jgi:hypothetical protein
VHPKIRKFGIGVTLVVTAMCLGWAYAAAREGYWITVAIALGVTAGTIVQIRILLRSTDVSPRMEFSIEGTLLKPDNRIDSAAKLMMGTGALAAWIGLVAAFPYENLYIPLYSELPESFLVIPLVCLAAGVGLTWLWWRLIRQGGISFLWLTPEGFRFATVTSTQDGRWDDVTEITDKLPIPDGSFWDPMVLMMKDGSHCALDSPGTYTPRGTALIELVRYYWQHSEQRNDLTNGRAVQRLQDKLATDSTNEG